MFGKVSIPWISRVCISVFVWVVVVVVAVAVAVAVAAAVAAATFWRTTPPLRPLTTEVYTSSLQDL